MPGRYTALRTDPRMALVVDRELEDAFESDEEDEESHTESTPLTKYSEPNEVVQSSRNNESTSAIPGGYDFEREYEYDRPPPGSPPRPSATALPNDIGNSNGLLPSSPVRAPAPRLSFFRRTVGAILPMHYARVPSESPSVRRRGGGLENDGVFANVMAKPQRPRTVLGENGELHMVPEDSQKEAPPSYADAQADAVPAYWETTIHAPTGLDPNADMIIDDLPSGSVFAFGANLVTSFFFQFVGFALTYLLHTSHAAKHGSRAGLGFTLIQYGFYSRLSRVSEGEEEVEGGAAVGVEGSDSTVPDAEAAAPLGLFTSRDWIAFLLMTLGWFLVMSALFNFWRIKRWENSIRANSSPEHVTPEDIERDIAVRRNIESIFGFGAENQPARRSTRDQSAQGEGGDPVSPEALAQEQRLVRNLMNAGLI